VIFLHLRAFHELEGFGGVAQGFDTGGNKGEMYPSLYSMDVSRMKEMASCCLIPLTPVVDPYSSISSSFVVLLPNLGIPGELSTVKAPRSYNPWKDIAEF
jgi:hypothetical protein